MLWRCSRISVGFSEWWSILFCVSFSRIVSSLFLSGFQAFGFIASTYVYGPECSNESWPVFALQSVDVEVLLPLDDEGAGGVELVVVAGPPDPGLCFLPGFG